MDEDGNHVKSGGYWGHCGQDCEKSSTDQRVEFSILTEGILLFISIVYFN